MIETLTDEERQAIRRAKHWERRPRNESREHWRLKRLCRYIAWASGCWASAPEFALLDHRQSVSLEFDGKNPGRRSVVDMLAIGKVLTKREPTENPRWTNSFHYLGLIAYECKATLSDLRAGMVMVGAHKHYCVVPEALQKDALRLTPKHVGVIVAAEKRGSARGNPWHNRIVRGARRRDDAVLPMWCYTKDVDPPAEWARMLLGMASCNTNYAVRWRT